MDKINEAYNRGRREGMIEGVGWVAKQIEQYGDGMTMEHLGRLLKSINETAVEMDLATGIDPSLEDSFVKKVKTKTHGN